MIEVKSVEGFKKEVLEVNVPVVLVDFWAAWCQPCLILEPVLAELSANYEGRVKVVRVNVDEARELAQNHQVMSIPTVLFFKQGEIKDRSIGAVPKEILAEKLNALLESKE
jgi:thioredoxin 1